MTSTIVVLLYRLRHVINQRKVSPDISAVSKTIHNMRLDNNIIKISYN